MPFYNSYVVDEILIPAVFVFFLVSGIFGFVFGAGLALFQTRVLRLFSPMNRWISARKSFAAMEMQRDLEPFIHKHRRVFAAAFVIGGLFSIIMLSVYVDAAAVATVFGTRKMAVVGPLAIQSLITLLIIGSLTAIVIGIVVGFFPRALGRLETAGNRWVSSRQMGKGADTMHLPLDRWFEASPRVFGIMLALASMFLTVLAATLLLGHR